MDLLRQAYTYYGKIEPLLESNPAAITESTIATAIERLKSWR
jgi:hypothetical protein